MMIHIEIKTPGNGKSYEYKIDDAISVAELITQLHAQIIEFEANSISFDKKQPLLCNSSSQYPLNPEHTLYEENVVSGNKLFLL